MRVTEPAFRVGDIVRLRSDLFHSHPEYAYYFLAYQGHEFKVLGYLLDDDDRPLLDHIVLECTTGDIKVDGGLHDTNFELA